MMSIKHCAVHVALVTLLASVQVVVGDGDVTCSYHPPILPRNTEYRGRCEKTPVKILSEADLWPCFKHSTGSLVGADVAAFPKSSQLMASTAELIGKFAFPTLPACSNW